MYIPAWFGHLGMRGQFTGEGERTVEEEEGEKGEVKLG